MRDQIIGKVVDLVCVLSGSKEDILPTTRIIEDGYIDSLSVFNVITNLEKIFGIRINPMDATINDFQTPESIASLVEVMLDKDKVVD